MLVNFGRASIGAVQNSMQIILLAISSIAIMGNSPVPIPILLRLNLAVVFKINNAQDFKNHKKNYIVAVKRS